MPAAVQDFATGLELELSLRDGGRVINEKTFSNSPELQSMIPPLRARDPIPADGAAGVTTPLLRWTQGNTAVVHNVYLGTDPSLGPEDLVMSRRPIPVYYQQSRLTPGTTYYWRVDEVTETGVIVTGDVWTFTAQ